MVSTTQLETKVFNRPGAVIIQPSMIEESYLANVLHRSMHKIFPAVSMSLHSNWIPHSSNCGMVISYIRNLGSIAETIQLDAKY